MNRDFQVIRSIRFVLYMQTTCTCALSQTHGTHQKCCLSTACVSRFAFFVVLCVCLSVGRVWKETNQATAIPQDSSNNYIMVIKLIRHSNLTGCLIFHDFSMMNNLLQIIFDSCFVFVTLGPKSLLIPYSLNVFH